MIYNIIGIFRFHKIVDNCDRWPVYKGGDLHRFYCNWEPWVLYISGLCRLVTRIACSPLLRPVIGQNVHNTQNTLEVLLVTCIAGSERE